MAAPHISAASLARSHGGQFWYQAQRMPMWRVPVYVRNLRVLVDFDLEDLEIAKLYTPVLTGFLRDSWYVDGNYLINPAGYAGFVEFGHHTRSGTWVPGQFFAQRAADQIARKYAAKTGQYIANNVDKIFSRGEMTIHFKVNA